MTSIEWIIEQIKSTEWQDKFIWHKEDIFEQAKEMHKQETETLYTKEDVLKAGEIGEVNHFDYKHIVSLLDEAKAINKSLKQPKQ
jgi:hypothetical protein